MNLIAALRAIGLLLFGRLSFCALVGGMIGAICGFLFTVIQTGHAPGAFPNQLLFNIGLVLGAAAFLLVLLIVGGLCRYGVRAIFFGALVNSLLTSVLTVFVADRVGRPPVTALLGLITGIVVGSILCQLCRWGQRE